MSDQARYSVAEVLAALAVCGLVERGEEVTTALAAGRIPADGGKAARGYSWPPFQPGNQLAVGNTAALRHGGFSAQRIGERARLVFEEVLELAPHLATDENALALSAYAMARARTELLSAAIELAVAKAGAVGLAGKIGARIIEAATSASREEAAQRASLGLDPRSLAELRAISSTADLNVALFARIAPEVPRAITEALEEMGHGEEAEEFVQRFVAALRAAEEEEDQ
jgi:hypothetical protein